MRVFISIISLFIFIWLANNVSAISYKSDIKISENWTEENTNLNIKWAKLIEWHVIKFKKNINKLAEKYKITSDKNIIWTNKILDKMILSLRKIQTKKVKKETAEEVMRSVIKDLKEINEKIKWFLKEKRKDFEDNLEVYKKKYSKISKKLSWQLNKIIENFAKPLTNKKILSLKESNILNHLKILKKESNKLKNFDKINFKDKGEIKSSLLRVLKNIKKEISWIKELINS